MKLLIQFTLVLMLIPGKSWLDSYYQVIDGHRRARVRKYSAPVYYLFPNKIGRLHLCKTTRHGHLSTRSHTHEHPRQRNIRTLKTCIRLEEHLKHKNIKTHGFQYEENISNKNGIKRYIKCRSKKKIYRTIFPENSVQSNF